MDKTADLHIHTFYSDSTASPEEVVQDALACGLHGIAVTDHDTVEGVNPALEAAVGTGLTVIPGVELSTEIDGKDIHILGYLFDCEQSKLVEQLSSFRDTRMARITKMIEKLKDQGVDNITMEDIFAFENYDAIGRPHLAALLIQKGWVKDNRQAFDKYLGEDCPAYVPKFKQTPQEAIALIKEAHGVAVMAHPMVANRDDLIPSFVEAGLDGIEVYYPNFSNNTIRRYENIAEKHHLVMTGGSDAHGRVKDNTYIGRIKVDYSCIEQLEARRL